MSLDIYLYLGEHEVVCSECGAVRSERRCVFSANITHNLAGMADAAGFYWQLWHPDAVGCVVARQVAVALRVGIEKMRAAPGYFKMHNAPNGWGTYENFLLWCEEYLAACETYPEATVEVSR